MYTLMQNDTKLAEYNSIRTLYYSDFHVIVINFNFQHFSIYLNRLNIFDYLDTDGLIIGTIRGNLLKEDEIELLSDNELFTVLNKCLINGYRIQYNRSITCNIQAVFQR